MAIIASEVESIHGDPSGQRMIFYRFQDESGAWHSRGPIITTDARLDLGAQMSALAQKLSGELSDDRMLEVGK